MTIEKANLEDASVRVLSATVLTPQLVLGELSTDLSTTSLKRLEALKHAIAGLNDLSCNAEELPDLPDDAILDEAEPSQFTRVSLSKLKSNQLREPLLYRKKPFACACPICWTLPGG